MMHELAHNKQMNHAKHFWAVRNEFAAEMKGLWDKGYSGEGLWGRGTLLENGAFAREELEEGEALPDHLCGGGFRSRGRKRKPKPKITYRERRERRERKMNTKYGSGTALGGDEETRVKLEKGKRPLSNPKKANTARGRELRAAAALARFETKKEEEEKEEEEEEEIKPNDDDLVTDSEAEDGVDDTLIKSEPDDAVDVNGKPLLDTQGRHMVKICKEEDKDDDDAKLELWELQNMGESNVSRKDSRPSLPTHTEPEPGPANPSRASERSEKEKRDTPSPNSRTQKPSKKLQTSSKEPPSQPQTDSETEPQQTNTFTCPICSVGNDPAALTCSVCANVLQPSFVPDSWRCRSKTCRDSSYINAGDVGICGVCGTRKCSD